MSFLGGRDVEVSVFNWHLLYGCGRLPNKGSCSNGDRPFAISFTGKEETKFELLLLASVGCVWLVVVAVVCWAVCGSVVIGGGGCC